jgi:hypothetical protein
MELTVSNWPCTSFLVGWRRQTHILLILYEIIIETRDGIEDQVQAIVEESMEDAFKQMIPEVPFVVEPKIVDSLG